MGDFIHSDTLRDVALECRNLSFLANINDSKIKLELLTWKAHIFCKRIFKRAFLIALVGKRSFRFILPRNKTVLRIVISIFEDNKYHINRNVPSFWNIFGYEMIEIFW